MLKWMLSASEKASRVHFAAFWWCAKSLTWLKLSAASSQTNNAFALSSSTTELLTLYYSWLTNSACNKTARGGGKKSLCKSQRRHDKQSGSQMLSAWCLTVHRCSLLFPALVFIRFISRSFSSLMDQRTDLRAGKTHGFAVHLHFTAHILHGFTVEQTQQVDNNSHSYVWGNIATAYVQERLV